jgi:hypothetical protein
LVVVSCGGISFECGGGRGAFHYANGEPQYLHERAGSCTPL